MTSGNADAAWLRLTLIPGIGGETQRKLLKAFGLPERVFATARSDLATVVGGKADLLLDFDNSEKVGKAMAWAQAPNHHLLTLADAEYPARLLDLPDPPTVLYVRGRVECLNRNALAIVGSRNATPQGAGNARAFARALAEQGFCIVSGLALGIDAAAHQGALEAGGTTIAVVGTGADRLYPARNQVLAQEIAEKGTIVSEFPLGTPATASNFPRRNRIISGLSRGVLVVEAAVESGSLITARLAGEQGRDVFAIPGSIHSPQSRGCHRLIRQGAKLVETANDILEEFGQPALRHETGLLRPEPADPRQALVLDRAGHDPVTIDDLVAGTGLTADTLSVILLQLELDGRVTSLSGGRYQRML
jgi:DNA processing protein